ncbi:MAG: hypothetical protein U0136_00270 [Bdellovibrionota bacterium]
MIHRRSRVVRNSVVLSGLLLGASCLTIGCSKDEKKAAEQQSGISPVKSAKEIDLSKSLVSYLPDQTVGFFLWEGKHPAYKKLMDSPWASGQNDISKVLNESNPELDQLKDLLKKVGIDANDKETWRALFSEAAVFATGGPSADKAAALGVVFRADPSAKLSDKMTALRNALKQDAQVETADLKVSKGSGFSLKKKDAEPGSLDKVYVGWNQDTGVVGSSEWVVDNSLSAPGGKVPALVGSDQFAKAAKGLPQDEDRFATGYVDVAKLLEVAAKISPSSSAVPPNEVPVKAVSFAMAMDEAPQSSLRMIYDPADKSKNQWLGALNASSSSSLLQAMPNKPLVFLSLDGQTLKKAKEIGLQSAGPAGKAYASQLAFLDNIKRVGLAARPAAPGKSMIPMPDILLVLESSGAASTESQLKQILGGVAQGMGMPGMQWSEKQIAGVPVKSMVSPFGVGIFLASNKDLVIVSSSEAQMQGALSGSTTGTFAAGMPARVEQVFAKEQTLGNIYVNFEEVGTMMESMGGMLAMYAPPNGDANKLLEAKNIESIKKMGTVVGSVKLEDGAIGVDSYYQQPAKPTA